MPGSATLGSDTSGIDGSPTPGSDGGNASPSVGRWSPGKATRGADTSGTSGSAGIGSDGGNARASRTIRNAHLLATGSPSERLEHRGLAGGNG